MRKLEIYSNFDMFVLGKVSKKEDDKIARIIFTWDGGFESPFEDFFEIVSSYKFLQSLL